MKKYVSDHNEDEGRWCENSGLFVHSDYADTRCPAGCRQSYIMDQERMEIGKKPRLSASWNGRDTGLVFDLTVTRTITHHSRQTTDARFTELAAECGFTRDPGETLGAFLRRIERAGAGWTLLLSRLAEELPAAALPRYELEWDIVE